MSKIIIRDINQDDRDYLTLIGIPSEVVNITTTVVERGKENDVEYITVDGLMYYYRGIKDIPPNISDSTDYYYRKDYLDSRVARRYREYFDYPHNSELKYIFLFHKKEKIRKLSDKL